MPGTIPAFCWSPCWWTVPGEGNKACLLQMDSVQARMPSADFLPALEEWRRRVTPPPPAPVKK